jgi:hypothetical protein
MGKVTELDKLCRELDLAVRKEPQQYRALQGQVADRFFSLLSENTPPDDEGRLRASLNRQPFKGQSEWVEEYDSRSVEAGTKVYYAPMVNDGHVIGVRDKGHNHGSKNGKRRAKGAYSINKGWAEGTFFTEKAVEQMEQEMPHMAADFLKKLLRGVGS